MLKLNELHKLRESVQDQYAKAEDGEINLSAKEVEQLEEVLDWSIQQLQQRKKNTKTYLIRSKERDKILKEQLSKDELETIYKQARERAERLMEGED